MTNNCIPTTHLPVVLSHLGRRRKKRTITHANEFFHGLLLMLGISNSFPHSDFLLVLSTSRRVNFKCQNFIFKAKKCSNYSYLMCKRIRTWNQTHVKFACQHWLTWIAGCPVPNNKQIFSHFLLASFAAVNKTRKWTSIFSFSAHNYGNKSNRVKWTRLHDLHIICFDHR